MQEDFPDLRQQGAQDPIHVYFRPPYPLRLSHKDIHHYWLPFETRQLMKIENCKKLHVWETNITALYNIIITWLALSPVNLYSSHLNRKNQEDTVLILHQSRQIRHQRSPWWKCIFSWLQAWIIFRYLSAEGNKIWITKHGTPFKHSSFVFYLFEKRHLYIF